MENAGVNERGYVVSEGTIKFSSPAPGSVMSYLLKGGEIDSPHSTEPTFGRSIRVWRGKSIVERRAKPRISGMEFPGYWFSRVSVDQYSECAR